MVVSIHRSYLIPSNRKLCNKLPAKCPIDQPLARSCDSTFLIVDEKRSQPNQTLVFIQLLGRQYIVFLYGKIPDQSNKGINTGWKALISIPQLIVGIALNDMLWNFSQFRIDIVKPVTSYAHVTQNYFI